MFAELIIENSANFLGMAVHECNPSTREVETGGFVQGCVITFLKRGTPSHSLTLK